MMKKYGSVCSGWRCSAFLFGVIYWRFVGYLLWRVVDSQITSYRGFEDHG